MHKKDFNGISIRGRVAFGVMCFERYVMARHPGRDFAPVCRLMWDIVSDKDYIDASAEHYMEIVPEYLYEFEAYEDAGFEFLGKEEFESMRKLVPSDDPGLGRIMHSIYDIAMEHAYGAVEAPAKASIDCVFEIVEVLENNGVALPDIGAVKDFSFEKSGGWGKPIDYRGLSLVLR